MEYYLPKQVERAQRHAGGLDYKQDGKGVSET
jgi:hypothetical protein